MDESNVYSKWKHICANNEERIRICMQVKELINMRDIFMNGIFKNCYQHRILTNTIN